MIVRTFCLVILCEWLLLDFVATKPSTEPADQKGPCVGMDCLHGVLMHNDEKQGEEHKAEDQYLKFKSVLDTENPRPGPKDAEEQLHGILMHGDSESGSHHEDKEILPDVKKDVGVKDLSDVIHEGMHGAEGHTGKHSWDEKNTENGDKIDSGPHGEKFMHGVLMHGDADHVHSESSEDNTEVESAKKIGPTDAEQYLHGVMMHGDSEPGVEHTHEAKDTKEDNAGNVGPNNDLHGILMHGDSNVGHDHSKEDAESEFEVFNDITKILDMELDEELLRIIDIKAILEKDKREYADWILKNPQFMDESVMGSTMADVSDNILADIELMKKRYLADRGEDNDVPKKKEDDIPFTAEDVMSVYTGDEHEEGEDMRHDLELAGSTEPINARHKVKMALMKATENQ